MIRQLIKSRRRRILVDVSTQKDYFLADGKACIRNHRRVLANIRRMMAWARRNRIPVISTCEVYTADNGDSRINYCLDGSDGQKKINYTLLADRVSFPADNNIDLPSDILRRHRQVILHERCTNAFDEPVIERLLSEIFADEFIVIGANTEEAVKATALGLLQRGRRVTVISDAVGSRNHLEAKLALRKVRAKGARLAETKKIAGASSLQHVGICGCQNCRTETVKKPVKVGIFNLSR